MDFPKEFDDRHWWILLGIAGALIATAAVAVTFVPGFIIGLSLLLFGTGQWIDHPIQTGLRGAYIVTGYPWRPSALGCGLSLIAMGLFGYGIYRLLTA